MTLRLKIGGWRQGLIVSLLAVFIVRWAARSLADEPEIALLLGEPWEDMRQRSSAQIMPAIPGHYWFRIPETDARLRFVDPQYGFVTPLARFFTISFDDERVANIRMSPQIEPLLLDDALKIVLDLQDQWRARGWVPMRRNSAPPFADTTEWRTQFQDVNRGGTTYWQAGEKFQILLDMGRFKDRKHPNEQRYLITLELSKPWLPEHVE